MARAAATPQRIRLSRRRGWRLPATAVNVARPSRWGNPFVVGVHGTRQRCVDLYFLLALGVLTVTTPAHMTEQEAAQRALAEAPARLRGKDLACWCPLPAPGAVDCCHATVLLAVANGARLEVPAHLRGALRRVG